MTGKIVLLFFIIIYFGVYLQQVFNMASFANMQGAPSSREIIAKVVETIEANSKTTRDKRAVHKTGLPVVRTGEVADSINATISELGHGGVITQGTEKAWEEKNANEHGKDGYDAQMAKAGIKALNVYADTQWGSATAGVSLVGATEEQRAEIARRAEEVGASDTCPVGLVKSVDFMEHLDEVRAFLRYAVVVAEVVGQPAIMVGGNALGRTIPKEGPDFVDTDTCATCPFEGPKAEAVHRIAKEEGLRLVVPNRNKGLGIGGVWAAQVLYNNPELKESWDWSGSQLVQYVRQGDSVIRVSWEKDGETFNSYEYAGDDQLLKACA